MLNTTHQTLQFFLPSFLDHQRTPPDLSETETCAETSADGRAQLLPGSCGMDSASICIKIGRKTRYEKKNNTQLNEGVSFMRAQVPKTDTAAQWQQWEFNSSSKCHLAVLPFASVSSNYHLSVLQDKQQFEN